MVVYDEEKAVTRRRELFCERLLFEALLLAVEEERKRLVDRLEVVACEEDELDAG